MSLSFDRENIGEFTELSPDATFLRRSRSYWHSSAWCPQPLVPRVLLIDDTELTAIGFSVIVRSVTTGYTGTLKLGLAFAPITVDLRQRHILGVPDSITEHVDNFGAASELALGDEVGMFVIPSEHNKVLVTLNGSVVGVRRIKHRAGPVTQAFALVEPYGKVDAVELVSLQEPLWSPDTHHSFSLAVKREIEAVLKLALLDEHRQAVFESSPWFVLPPELLFIIFQHIATSRPIARYHRSHQQ